jgi:hypothetical protein
MFHMTGVFSEFERAMILCEGARGLHGRAMRANAWAVLPYQLSLRSASARLWTSLEGPVYARLLLSLASTTTVQRISRPFVGEVATGLRRLFSCLAGRIDRWRR